MQVQNSLNKERKAHNSYSIENVKNFIESKGCKLISEEYISNKNILLIQCSCGNIFERSFSKFKNRSHYNCGLCSGHLKLTEKEIRDSILKKHNFEILSENFSYSSKVDVKCLDCGNIYKNKRVPTLLKAETKMCNVCNIDYIEHTIEGVKKYIENHSDSKLIEEKYINSFTKMKFQCNCGQIFEKSLSKFKEGRHKCKKCNGIIIVPYEEIKEIIEKDGNKLITEKKDFINITSPIKIQCGHCGKIYEKSFRIYRIDVNKV